MWKLILAIFLLDLAVPAEAETTFLVLKSTLQGKGISLVTIPMTSIDKCEEQGALITTSERFDIRFANQDAFECVSGK